MIKPAKSINIFSITEETFNLAFPFVCLFLALIEKLFLSPATDLPNENIMRFIANVIFFSGIHAAFTYTNIFYFKQVKNVLRYYKFAIGSHLIIFLMFWIIFFNQSNNYSFLINTFFLSVLITISFNIFHISRQSLGLSLLYNYNYLNTLPEESKKIFIKNDNLSRIFEKTAVNLIWLAGFINAIQSLKINWLRANESFFHKIFIGLTIMSCAALILSYVLIIKHKPLIKRKILFFPRYFIYLFSHMSIFVLFASRAIHGVESLFMQKNLYKNSEVTNKKKYWFLTIVMLILVTLSKSQSLFTEFNLINNLLLINILSAFSASFTYYHIVLESFIYKMKNPYVRSQVGQLLLAKS